ncbi:hypothetical protein [Actinocrispum wychmicini]|uniref:hypothetical protein n=1 Tax=Actinocrispum wychmicini TaxID=1213861 RepID=UPI00104C261B|nr:hypothetical protein [Actinocrispum wychmicini]
MAAVVAGVVIASSVDHSTPARNVVTRVAADACSLVTRATIDTYVRGVACEAKLNSDTLKTASWYPDPGDYQHGYVSLVVSLIVLSDGVDPVASFEEEKEQVPTRPSPSPHSILRDDRPVIQLGDDAHVFYWESNDQPDGATTFGDAEIVVRVRNVMVTASHGGYVRKNDNETAPVSQQDAEAAATAAAKDAISWVR